VAKISLKELIKIRAEMLRQVRLFFYKRKVLEVDSPHLGQTTTPDPQVLSIRAGEKYLLTSPEFFLKRLLANGSGDVFQMAHVFRDDMDSPRHRKEFMLLEWYRVGFDLHKLMHEVFDLVSLFLPGLKFKAISYKNIYKKHTGIDDVFMANKEELAAIWQKFKQTDEVSDNMSKTDWLDLIMLDIIEPNLSGAVFIHSYPREQAALARIENGVALRFELYINGVEIANGFDELTVKSEQRARLRLENKKREKLGLEQVPLDNEFLSAVASLPQCSGVALGIDRLLMVTLGLSDINQVGIF